jgi:hypothetical protein
VSGEWTPPEIPDEDFVFRLPAWIGERIAELRAEGKTAEEIVDIVRKEALR